MFRLCNSQVTCPLRFSLYSKQENGKTLLYGYCEVTPKEILDNVSKERELLNEKSKVRLGGMLRFEQFEVVEQPSFVDYLKNGWYINMTVAIDFTASNGGLHELSPLKQNNNDYELAIREVGKILQPYSYRQ